MDNKAPVGDNADEFNFSSGWRKSSYSMSNGQCVETARLAGGRIGVRDSAAASGAVLRFDPATWVAFLAEVRTAQCFKV